MDAGRGAAGMHPARIRFDTSLADEVVVRREGHRWRLSVLRFTGDVLATTVLHLDGDFSTTVARIAGRTLQTMGLALAPDSEWRRHEAAWSASVVDARAYPNGDPVRL
ncbi:hypothetical protein SCB71_13150 [Herbiconiux sp. KACC 21604]|uniref:hypothetical protein n=1 Tax=unclassified Herbiconiux TaxID=2618217 RepID=UPI0014916921|nr:hypothetical protein [Herbiconiux sp. SALV-R1]QJU54107.1 hypothetical protein HL652_11100 [Herbiconiux sp. SALV-R1]WPO85158.1 hypothetical protein SCB71_13150 [Herbiconiux sp. KACC 21604]